jgi:hypothetical protein
LTKENGEAPTYIAMVRHNISTIASALANSPARRPCPEACNSLHEGDHRRRDWRRNGGRYRRAVAAACERQFYDLWKQLLIELLTDTVSC